MSNNNHANLHHNDAADPQTIWQYSNCPKCGAKILHKSTESPDKKPCKNCAKLHSMARQQRQARFLNSPNTTSLIVEYDPLPMYDGGFRKGTHIPTIQVACMCSYSTFVDGTILRDKFNRLYKVNTKRDGKQKLSRINS